MYILLAIGQTRGRTANQRRGYFRSGPYIKDSAIERPSSSFFWLSSSVAVPRSSTRKVEPVHRISHRSLHFEAWIIRSL